MARIRPLPGLGAYALQRHKLAGWVDSRFYSSRQGGTGGGMAGKGAQDAAAEIVARLRASGHQAYFVGGCVRDLLLGREPDDYDVATSALPDLVLTLFEKTFAVGAHFGVVLVCSKASGRSEVGDQEVVTEVATFRSDGIYSDGRHPDVVQFSGSRKRM